MEQMRTNIRSISPADFLYYDPYYLALKERSKAYPDALRKRQTQTSGSDASSESGSARTPKQQAPSDTTNVNPHEIVTDIVKDLSSLMETDLFSEGRVSSPLSQKLLAGRLPAATSVESQGTRTLISELIREASAVDARLGDKVRKLGDEIYNRDRVISELRQALDVPPPAIPALAEKSKALDNAEAQLLANTRVISSLYSDIDKLKKEIDSLVEKNANLSQRLSAASRRADDDSSLEDKYSELKLKYDSAMRIIDKMNWAQFDQPSANSGGDNN